MGKRHWIASGFCILLLCSGIAAGHSFKRFECSVETGLATAGYNDIRIPGTTGTLISFSEELETDPTIFIRGRFTYFFNKDNSLSLLVAPLKLYASGSVDRQVIFESDTFAPNVSLSSTFHFDSYRLTYQHYWFFGNNLDVGLGITAKVRNAAIRLADSIHYAEKTNVGFVPLIRFSLAWRILPPFALIIDGDALAAPQGRAEDVAIAIQGDVTERAAFRLGYRVLEGGSDVDEVYSFSWVNFFFGGVIIRF